MHNKLKKKIDFTVSQSVNRSVNESKQIYTVP